MAEQIDTSVASHRADGATETHPTLAHAPENTGAEVDIPTAALLDRYRALVEATAQIVWSTDSEGQAVEFWPAWHDYTGQTEEDASGFGWLDAIHPDDQQLSIATWRRAVAERRPAEITHRIRRHDGVYRWFHVRAVPILSPDGVIREWVGVCNDITEQRQQDEERDELLRREREARAHLEAVLEVLPAATIIADPNGKITHVNEAFREVWGEHTLAEGMEEYAIYRAWHPDGTPVAPDEWALSRALRYGETVHGQELEIDAFDGVRKTILNNAAPLLDTNGRVVSGVVAFSEITERKRLEQERLMFAQIAENSSEFIGVCDTQFRAFYVNRAAMRMVGLDSLEQVKQTEIKDYFFPEDQAFMYDEFFPQVLRDGHAEVEIRFRHFKTGEALWMIYSVDVLKDTRGEPFGYATISRNITDRKRLERELETRARELMVIMEAMTDGVVVYGPSGEVRFMNAAYRLLLAMGDVEMQYSLVERGRAIALRDPATGDPLAESEWPSLRLLHGEVLAGAGSVDVLARAHDGREVLINCTGAPLLDETGKPHGAVMVTRDVAKRRQLERRTREALDALLAMAEALVLVRGGEPDDASPDVETFSRLAALMRQLLGCERVALVRYDTTTGLQEPLAVVGISHERELRWRTETSGTRLANYLDPHDMVRLHAGESILFESAPSSQRRVPEGDARPLIIPMRIGEQLVGMLVLDHGSTSHAYTLDEISLADAAAQLAALVVERDRLLRERAAAEDEALILAEANRRMDEFLSIASHEVRTPLTTIKANVHLARQRAERLAAKMQATGDDTTRDMEAMVKLLSRAALAIERQNRLVNDLLDVSRIQQGRSELRVEPLDIVRLTRDVVEEQRVVYPGRHITLTLPRRGVSREVPVVADGDRIRQVIANYLVNALKYSDPQQPVATTLEVDGSNVRVTVADHGPGIPLAEREHIWERFHQVAGIDHQSGSHVGLGLGLYISRDIVERHGGHVGVEDAPGGGSIFWFTLPLAT